MSVWTKGNVADMEANPAFVELMRRAENLLTSASAKVENPGEFNQGWFVGVRNLVQTLRGLPQTLRDEADGKAMTTKMR